jgi:sugar lactone lactonase YvrE
VQSSGKAAVVQVAAGIAALLIALAALGGSAAAQSRPRGDVRVLALVPPPGYPALPHILGGEIFEGTYDNPNGSPLPSRVLEYTIDGALETSWTVAGQDTSQPHGVQVAANDQAGRLLLLDKTSGRIILLDPRTGAQTLYGRVPHVPPCSSSAPGAECKDSTQDLAPMPDYAAWGADGSLYVTDYQQATIWRVPPGGGTAQLWLTDKRLDGGQFGTACILLMPDHHTLLFDQASNGGLGSLNTVANSVSPTMGAVNPTTGKLYEISILPGNRPGPMQQLWESGPADAPDGCALTTSGHVFVALAGASNQIVELDSSGHEIARFGQQFSGNNNSSVPFDTPSGLGCTGTSLIVANQSYLAGNSANQALLDVETGEQCAAVFVPAAPAVPAAQRAKHRHKRRHKRISRRPRTRVGFTG